MRILITGARGMLGTDACRYFSEGGHDVVGADLDVTGSPRQQGASAQLESPLPSGFIPLDITQSQQVRREFLRVKPDVVLHCAAYTNVDGCERDADTAFKVNAFGTWAVACATEEVGASLVAISTDFVFDGAKGSPYTEFDAPNPLSRYGASKRAGEELALRHCSRAYVVRTAWLYGVHGNNFPYAIVKRAKEKGELSVVADQLGTPTYTLDLVRAVDEIIKEPLYGVYHASNEGETSWRNFAKAILDRVGLEKVPVHPLTSAEYATNFNSPTRRPANSVMRNSVMELRGAPPMRSWTEALDDFVEAAKAAGKI
jgi:dTDP-4-dehydrorhamnose reductase